MGAIWGLQSCQIRRCRRLGRLFKSTNNAQSAIKFPRKAPAMSHITGFFTTKQIPFAKSRFLMVGATARHVKIVTERVQVKKKAFRIRLREKEQKKETNMAIRGFEQFSTVFNLRSVFLFSERWRGLDGESAVGGRRSDVPRRAPACLEAIVLPT